MTRRQVIFRHLSPRGTILLFLSALWLILGVGTWQDYAGRPDGAPHLMIPEQVRGTAWIVSAVVAGVVASLGRRHLHTIAVVALMTMPAAQCASYAWAWITHIIGHHILGDETIGAPGGYYAAALWALLALFVVAARLAPTTWGYLRRVRADEDRDRRKKAP